MSLASCVGEVQSFSGQQAPLSIATLENSKLHAYFSFFHVFFFSSFVVFVIRSIFRTTS